MSHHPQQAEFSQQTDSQPMPEPSDGLPAEHHIQYGTHFHPRRLQHRAASRLTIITLVMATIAIPAQILLALFGAPLMIGTALFTALLVLPLLLQSVLHPGVITSPKGLTLYPTLWRAKTITWSEVQSLIPHPLIYNDDLVGTRLHGKNYRPRMGMIVVLKRNAPVSLLYRMVGVVSGAGVVPAFGISSTTHTGYETLLETLKAHLAQIPK